MIELLMNAEDLPRINEHCIHLNHKELNLFVAILGAISVDRIIFSIHFDPTTKYREAAGVLP